ncbi:bile acid transporter [Brucella abortus F6/05-3]|nr:sodium Bile acid symporter family protein [Brucella abortus]EEX83125.1 sodium/bile acid transporter [Brucella abortus bv. 3 str. Tulya]ENP34726.1 bile acid transporter [Brucella abortus 65/110]ENP41577.1 bile acid transporter [Brucella abortus 78/36]ENQ03529.1 bile acid transporter [Brucella abortus F6/05-2]ENR85704.1 bile acid transporter [Brucella abortus 78/14]ENR89148.1 bile acid transporter [Brucella abortus 78/32]ENR91526.1 bile acid transporter [Brucella abortus 80/101]ENR95929.1 
MKAIAAFSDFVGRSFAIWVIVFAALGFVMPATFSIFAPWIVVLLGIIMFGMGLTISGKDFAEVAKRPFDVAIGVLAQFIIMPLLAVLLTRIIPMSPEVAAGVILVGCCPGGTASNVMTYLSKGDVALSVACTSVTTLLAPLVTPFLVWFFASQYLPVDAMSMFISIVKVILVPLALGFVLRKLVPGVVKAAVPMLPLVSVVGIVLIVAAVVAVNKAAIAQSGLLIFAVVVLHNCCGLLLGYFAARFAGLSLAKRKAISIEVGMQNSGLGGCARQCAFLAACRGAERRFQRLAQYFRCAGRKLLCAHGR